MSFYPLLKGGGVKTVGVLNPGVAHPRRLRKQGSCLRANGASVKGAFEPLCSPEFLFHDSLVM